MKQWKNIFVIVILSFTVVGVLFLKKDIDNRITRKPDALAEDASSEFSKLPNWLQGKLKEYLVMVGIESYVARGDHDIIDAGGSNTGIIAYNKNLLEQNSCFRDLVSAFYLDIAKQETKYLSDETSFSSYIGTNDLLSNTVNTGVPSGWVWDKALKIANGDPNLAMSLVGVCGHDNMSQIEEEETEDHCSSNGGEETKCETKIISEGQKLIRDPKDQATLKKYKELQLKKIFELWNPKSDEQKKYKEELLNEKDLHYNECPSVYSAFYRQGSLGKETLLPESIVKDISNIQAPTAGGSALSAKYYHTIGAAIMTCSLVREGVPGFVIKKIQLTLINTYRMARLCDLQSENQYFEEKTRDTNLDKIIETALVYRKNKSFCVEKIFKDGYESFNDDIPECKFLEDFQDILQDKDMDQNILRSKFQRKIAESHATNLFLKNITSLEKCQKIQMTNFTINKIKALADSTEPCPNLSQEECKRAKDVLKTWWVDFTWSEAQHLKGAEFAISKCISEPEYLESGLEKKSCAALEARGIATDSSKTQENGVVQ